MRRVTLVAVASSLAWAAAASADETPIPLKTPTGYRDYCDGQKRSGLCPRGGVPRRLWRPLALPTVALGELCPVSRPHSVTPRAAPVLGSGPVYFAPGAYNPGDRSTMTAAYPAPHRSLAAGTGWTIAKAPLLMRRTVRQPLVIRGRRLDGPESLGFSGHTGRRPFAAIQFPTVGYTIPLGSHKAHSLNVWATAAGCYAVQIDGMTFSSVVVFRIEFLPLAYGSEPTKMVFQLLDQRKRLIPGPRRQNRTKQRGASPGPRLHHG